MIIYLVCWHIACAPVTPSPERVALLMESHPGATVQTFMSVTDAEAYSKEVIKCANVLTIRWTHRCHVK